MHGQPLRTVLWNFLVYITWTNNNMNEWRCLLITQWQSLKDQAPHLCIQVFTKYFLTTPPKWKLLERRGHAYLFQCQIPKAFKGAWHMVGAQKIPYYTHLICSLHCFLSVSSCWSISSRRQWTLYCSLMCPHVPRTMLGTLYVLHKCF